MAAFFDDYELIRKSGLFDPEYYLSTYPDLEEQNVDPLVHYLEEGAREGRNPHPNFDTDFYLEQCRSHGEKPDNALIHFIRDGAARGLKAHRDAPGNATVSEGVAKDIAESTLRLAVESLGIAAPVGGGLRLSINGWAWAPSSIAEISAAIDGKTVGTAVHGLARPDIAKLHPEHENADQSGFILAIELPRQVRPNLDLLLTVRTATGEVGQRPLHVDIPPEATELVAINPLDTTDPADSTAPARPSMELFVDRIDVDDSGILRVEGWVVCLVQIEMIEAYIGDARIGEAEFGRVRDDIGVARADYPNARFSGFFLASNVSRHGPGNRTITVKALARTGISRLATAMVDVPEIEAKAATDEPFRHHCDEVLLTSGGRIVLKGWAVAEVPITAITVSLDGAVLGEMELHLERPDVGNHFPEFPHARQSGFQFHGNAGQSVTAEHLLTLQLLRKDHKFHEVVIPVAAVNAPEDEAMAGRAETAGDRDRKLHLDVPVLIGGAMEMPVRGNLEISGWALARAGVAAIDIAVDGNLMVTADYGIRRLDIQAAFPDWENALGSGFLALIPHRVLPVGNHVATVTLRDNQDRTVRTEFRIKVEPLSDAFGPWSLRRKIPPAEVTLGRTVLERRGWHPQFFAILPLSADTATLAQAALMLASLRVQAYPDWRLFVVPRSDDDSVGAIRDWMVDGFNEIADKIEIRDRLTPATLIPPRSDPAECFVTILSAGDELGCDAFLELALTTAARRDADFIYSDERRPNVATGCVEAFFKPQWSPDLLLSTNYIGRLWCVRGDLLTAVTEPDERLPDYGEYDLVLRCTEASRTIHHVPAVLCESAGLINSDDDASRRALARAVVRRGIAGEIRPGRFSGAYRLKRAVVTEGMVSIIIPTRATRGMIKTCIETLRRLTAYPNYEIVCIENIPPDDQGSGAWLQRNADWVVSTEEPFNWSRFNNLAAAQATGEFFLFLNDDIEIIDPDWLDALLEHAQRPEIGVVGPQLLYPDHRVQHAGMFLAAMGQGRHAFRYAGEDEPGYFGLALSQRNVIAVTGACLLVRRETYNALGGFDEAHGVINNDLDFCLRAWQSGLVNLYTPHAKLIHHEAVSRAGMADDYDAAVFDSRWRNLFLAGDPFFNPNLTRSRDDFSIDAEPNQLLYAGRPAISRDQIRRILIVKLDHIGDCIVAFPAVRRLKQHFPEACFTVLTSRASRAVWSMEPSVDEIIEFDFFHARSEMGLLERSERDWEGLRARLASGLFDLAIDLRKHLETRLVLQHTGARYLAGFDHRNQFPWLDVALEWGGDHAFARKRSHTVDDLINLADAIAAACETDRALVAARPPRSEAVAALQLKKSTAQPLICVHPTAGNVMKQWPVEYFAAVIDQLIEEDSAQIILIGGPGDEEVAAAIIQRLRQPEAVTSLVGKLPLGELPALLAEVSLFLGNDSGPKHIAAGLGVPTVGIHSGTIDPREWGPVGPLAVAVVREVVCSPCYLSQPEDCRRNLACLRQLPPDKVYSACKRLLLLEQETQPQGTPKPIEPAAKRRRSSGTGGRRKLAALQDADD